MKVTVIGTGYVGLPTALVFADLGNDVLCVDKDEAKVAMLRAGQVPIYEPGVEALLRRSLDDGLFKVTPSTDEGMQHGEVVFIAVGTPQGDDGEADLSAVWAVARDIAKYICHYTIIVTKSTVPVGTGDRIEQILVDAAVDRSMFDVVSNPEFLREGTALPDAQHPDRIVIGADNQAAAHKLMELFAPLEAPVIITDRRSSELIKYASNTFLAIKISFINAISRMCEECGADVSAVARGMGSDPRIGNKFLQAGLGWGGSCLPKDVAALNKIAADLGYDFKMLQAADEVNEQQTRHFVQRLSDRIGGFQGKTIGLLGLAFKPNTDDIRDAKSLEIIEMLKAEGATIRAYDPAAAENVRAIHPDITYVNSALETGQDADAIILVTEWNEFKSLDLTRLGQIMRRKLIFDGRRVFTPYQIERAGFEYVTVGAKG
ncbi:MAG TPA: UDP-glucose/GDP-mannose dehydrogenase family protein [Fimbriimonadaceae bacterium]|nr:UDP-glucose 6-dehydrogenase [Armatimonadota bacterium]HRD31167.1 UDP-glucose/GDP-mannose dehydrogenase family protein [Fimbriimonadaceae bacterium]HRE93557.1 UDP-glucose/GDP-mannose dehydrogenase family protein [Fimbriimonadaceae bacterium]HRI73798.1 UDP-glucose/GDP-mannose dehydrogenase family protein [Fimbriimonadaceae bacterium]